MIDTINGNPVKMAAMAAIFTTALIMTASLPALGHGGKSHGGTGFSSLQAVQKATELYDRLITSGKLPEDWETDLTSIKVSTRKLKANLEYVVRFTRTDGDPDSVYFFFDQKGNYSGSNFTGK